MKNFPMRLPMRSFIRPFISVAGLFGVFLAFLAAFFVFPAFAQTTSAIEITADKFVVRADANESEFTGNVVITQTGLKVWADRVIVHYGAGGSSDISSFEALGGVRIASEAQTATGNRAVYNPKTRILRLTGNVVVVNDSGTVNSEELLVNLSSNITEFSSGNTGQRVTGLFTPTN